MKFPNLERMIEERRETLGLSERAVCLKARLGVDAIRGIKRGNKPGLDRLILLEDALGLPRDSLVNALKGDMLAGAGPGAPRTAFPAPGRNGRRLTVVGRATTGVWRAAESDETVLREGHGPPDGDDVWPAGNRLPVLPHPSFPEEDQFAVAIGGPSMNLQLAEGDFALCVRAGPDDVAAGDLVVVQRERMPSGLRELTVRELQEGPDGRRRLSPRSTDPRFQTPLDLPGDGRQTEDGETIVVAIIGRVIGTYRPLI